MPDQYGNSTPDEVAREWNLWIKYDDRVYSPDEFASWLKDNRESYVRLKANYINPYRDLRNGLNIISNMVTSKQEIDVILNSITRAKEFAEKIKASGYDPTIQTGKQSLFADW